MRTIERTIARTVMRTVMQAVSQTIARTVMLTKVSIGCSCRHKKADPVLTCVRMTKPQGDDASG